MSDFKLKGEAIIDEKPFISGVDKLKGASDSFFASFDKGMFGAVTASNLAAKAVGFLSASVKSAVGDFAQLDKGVAKVNTLINMSEGAAKAFKLEMLGVSQATGVWAGDLAEAAYQASSAGVATEELTGFVKEMAILSKAGFTDVASAVSVVSSTMNAYGKEVYTVNEISDKLLRTQNNGVTTVQQLSSALYNVVPSASALGVSLDEVLGGIATLTKSGVPTAQATTQMRNVINELADDTKGVGEVFRQLTGKTFVEFIKSGGTMADVMATLGSYADKTDVPVSRLFSSVESGTGALILAKDSASEFNTQIISLGNSAGDTATAHKIATTNISDYWEETKNKIRATSTEMVSEYETDLIAFLKFINKASTAASQTLAFFVNASKAAWSFLNADAQGFLDNWGKIADMFDSNEPQIGAMSKPKDWVSQAQEEQEKVSNVGGKDVGDISNVAKPNAVNKTKTSKIVDTSRQDELDKLREYNKQRNIIEYQFQTEQLNQELLFMQELENLKLGRYDSELIEETETLFYENQMLSKIEFDNQQLENDLKFYSDKEKYAEEHAEIMNQIKQNELSQEEVRIDRSKRIQDKELNFLNTLHNSKEDLLKGSYTSMVQTNGNILKSMGEFLQDSISMMMMQHGADLFYKGVNTMFKGKADIVQGVAHSANPMTPGLGAPLIAAGIGEETGGAALIAQSAAWGFAGAAIGSIGSSASSDSSSGSGTSEVVNNNQDTIQSLETEKKMSVYLDEDSAVNSLLVVLNQAAKDGFNVEFLKG